MLGTTLTGCKTNTNEETSDYCFFYKPVKGYYKLQRFNQEAYDSIKENNVFYSIYCKEYIKSIEEEVEE